MQLPAADFEFSEWGFILVTFDLMSRATCCIFVHQTLSDYMSLYFFAD
jgi:hypothetical protein